MIDRVEYLLACVAEEAGEVTKEAMKCIRFGHLNAYQDQPQNITRLIQEFYDVVAVMSMLLDTIGIEVPQAAAAEWIDAKQARVEQTMLESKGLGVLQDSAPAAEPAESEPESPTPDEVNEDDV